MDPLVKRVLAAHEPPASLRALLALREHEPFAPQALARVVSQAPLIVERIRLGYAAPTAVADYGNRRPYTVRDAIADTVGPDLLRHESAASWEWTYVVAAYTTVLAEALQRHTDDAFAAGLLLNASRLLMLHHATDDTERALERARQSSIPVAQAERDTLGYSHLEFGRALAEAWGLPGSIQPAFDEDADPESLSGLLRRAERIAWQHGMDDPRGVRPAAGALEERAPALDAFRESRQAAGGVLARLRGFMAAAHIEFQ
ncbi:MAG: HDOD domain-containing protein [Dehalococcoidia bacterium]|nr:HDOD domain-containing protein [Dehalococcoidia bacterium]